MYSNIEQLIPSDTLPQLSYEDINLELAQLDNSYFSQQLSDYIQYSYPSSNYTSSPEYYHSYSSSTPPTPPPPLEIKTEPTRKATKPKKYRNRRDEDITSAEIDQIRVSFKLKRIRLGLSQKQAAESVSNQVRKTSQTSLCRFENNQLHPRNMKSLAPHLRKWIELN